LRRALHFFLDFRFDILARLAAEGAQTFNSASSTPIADGQLNEEETEWPVVGMLEFEEQARRQRRHQRAPAMMATLLDTFSRL